MGQVSSPRQAGAITVNPINVTGVEPRIIFTETDAAANAGKWDIDVNGAAMIFRSRTDADGAGMTWLSATRAAASTNVSTVAITTVDDINLTAGAAAGDRITLQAAEIEFVATGAFATQGPMFFRTTNGAGDMDFNAGGEMVISAAAAGIFVDAPNGQMAFSTGGAGGFGVMQFSAPLDEITFTALQYRFAALGNFANDAAAAAGGVPVTGLYRNGSVVMIRVV